MKINQSERLAAESLEEREERLHQASEREPYPNREQPFKQCSVQMKMRRFHEYFCSLNSPRCSMCSESFPGIQLRPPTTECMRCHRNKHTPKLYSSANGMDPAWPITFPATGQYIMTVTVLINFIPGVAITWSYYIHAI